MSTVIPPINGTILSAEIIGSPKFQQSTIKDMENLESVISEEIISPKKDKFINKVLSVRDKQSSVLEIRNRQRSQSSKQRAKTQEKLAKNNNFKREKVLIVSNKKNAKFDHAEDFDNDQDGIMNFQTTMNYQVILNNLNYLSSPNKVGSNIKPSILSTPRTKLSPASINNRNHYKSMEFTNFPLVPKMVSSPKNYKKNLLKSYADGSKNFISRDLNQDFQSQSIHSNLMFTMNSNEAYIAPPSIKLQKSPVANDLKFSLPNSLITPHNPFSNNSDNSDSSNFLEQLYISDGLRNPEHFYAKILEEKNKLESISSELNHIQEGVRKYTNPFESGFIKTQPSYINNLISEQIDFQVGDTAITTSLPIHYNEPKNSLLAKYDTNTTTSFNYTQTPNANTRLNTSDNATTSIEFKTSGGSSSHLTYSNEVQKPTIFEDVRALNHIQLPEETKELSTTAFDSNFTPQCQQDRTITQLNLTYSPQTFMNQELIDKILYSYISPVEGNKRIITYGIPEQIKYVTSIESSDNIENKELYQNIYGDPFTTNENEGVTSHIPNLKGSIELNKSDAPKYIIRNDVFYDSPVGMEVDLSAIRQEDSPNAQNQSPIQNQIYNKYKITTLQPIHETPESRAQSILYKSLDNIEPYTPNIRADNTSHFEIDMNNISPNKLLIQQKKRIRKQTQGSGQFFELDSSNSTDSAISQKNSLFFSKEKNLNTEAKKYDQFSEDVQNSNQTSIQSNDNITKFINDDYYNSPNILNPDRLQNEDEQELNSFTVQNLNIPGNRSFTPGKKSNLNQFIISPESLRSQSVPINVDGVNNNRGSIQKIKENEVPNQMNFSARKDLDLSGYIHNLNFDESNHGPNIEQGHRNIIKISKFHNSSKLDEGIFH